MKHFTVRLIVALLTFTIGIVAASVWLINWHKQSKLSKSQSVVEQKIPADTFITLERTTCYGTCPSYTVTISADGTVLFNAPLYWVRKDNVDYSKRSGVIRSRISQDQLQQLISEFEKANYFSLNDTYGKSGNDGCPDVATDSPWAYTSIQINGRKKAIEHYYGCVEKRDGFIVYPQKLYKLENRIDEIVNTKQWLQ